MNLKMIMALVTDEKTETVIEAARQAGATGATIISSARGEGLKAKKSFFGLDVTGHRDVVLFMVAASMSREILEVIAKAGHFEDEPGTGIAVLINIEDAIGMNTQEETIFHEIEGRI